MPAPHRFHFGSVAALLLACLLPLSARAAEPAGGVWFDKTPAPLELSDPQIYQLNTALLEALRLKKEPRGFLDAFAQDKEPRLLFLTFRDGTDAPPVTVFAGGPGLREAARAALQKARETGRNAKATALKTDLVRHAAPVPAPGFRRLRSEPLPQPTVAGVAFTASSGFAFLPETLTGNDWVMPDRRLNLTRIGESLIGNSKPGKEVMEKIGAWQQVAANQAPITAWFFETQSWYTDGAKVTPLFRGHRLPGPVTVAQLRQTGAALAAFLAARQQADGSFDLHIPGWTAAAEPTLAHHALAALALLEWQAANPNGNPRGTAGRTLKFVTGRLNPLPAIKGSLAPVEADQTLRTDTAALLILALLRDQELAGRDLWKTQLDGLGLFLLRQVHADGALDGVRAYPDGTVRAPGSTADTGLAALACLKLYTATGRLEFQEAATRLLAATAPRQTASLAPHQPPDGWLLGAINENYTFTRNKPAIEQVMQIGVRNLSTQSWEPLFPDFLGGWDQTPDTAAAALAGLGLNTAAGFCRDTRRTGIAERLDDGFHLALAFLIQAQVDSVSLHSRPRAQAAAAGALPRRVTGEDLDLETQGMSLLAFAIGAKAAAARPDGILALTDPVKTAFAKAATQTAIFPRCLPQNLEKNSAPDAAGTPAGGAAVPAAIPVPKGTAVPKGTGAGRSANP